MAFSRAQLKMDAMEKKGYKNCITHCISFPRENRLPLREISFPFGNQMKIKSWIRKHFRVNWLPLREIFFTYEVKFTEFARDEWNWTLLQTYFSDLFWSLNYTVFSRPTSLIGKKRRFLFCNWGFSTSIVTQESYLCKTLSLI